MSQIAPPNNSGGGPTGPRFFDLDTGFVEQEDGNVFIFSDEGVIQYIDQSFVGIGTFTELVSDVILIHLFGNYNIPVNTEGLETEEFLIPTTTTGNINKTIYLYGDVVAYDASGNRSASYGLSGAFVRDSGIVRIIGVSIISQFEDVALEACDVQFTVTGLDAIIHIEVTGVPGIDILWQLTLDYRWVV